MRKNYLDNIRWTVIILVLVFHVVSIFSSCGAVMSINAPGIPALDTIGYLIYPWFMCLLFVVSGICARISLDRAPGFRAFHPGKRDPQSVCVPAGMGGVLYQGSSGNGAVLVPSAAVRFIRMFGGDQESGQKRTAVRAGRKMYAAHTAASVFPGACLRPNPVYRLYLPRGFVSASFSYGILCFLP